MFFESGILFHQLAPMKHLHHSLEEEIESSDFFSASYLYETGLLFRQLAPMKSLCPLWKKTWNHGQTFFSTSYFCTGLFLSDS
jgi:hypothetical protein